MFGILLTVSYSALLAYVVWRAATVPLLRRHLSLRGFIGVGAVLWALFFFGRTMGHARTAPVWVAFESAGMLLLGWAFLTATVLLLLDLGTLFGRVLSRWAPTLRGWAVLTGTFLSGIALVQGLRAPAVVSHEVSLPSLPAQLDGKVLVALSDAHLGARLGAEWLASRARQIQALRPDLVVLLGDMFEGHDDAPPELPSLQHLAAPLGKWFVDGNHESHGSSGDGAKVLAKAGFRRLANQWAAPTPGLVLAGVSDLTHHKRRGLDGDPLSRALAHRPRGATVLLSHTPWQVQRAAAAGVELMLAGHTHGGQIWPFGYLVRSLYPLLAGRYEVGGMPIIVSRGAGTWGPRMRLWRRGEIVRIILRAPPHPSATGRGR